MGASQLVTWSTRQTLKLCDEFTIVYNGVVMRSHCDYLTMWWVDHAFCQLCESFS